MDRVLIDGEAKSKATCTKRLSIANGLRYPFWEGPMRKIRLIQKDISTKDISKTGYQKNHYKNYKKRIQSALLVGGSFALLLSAVGCGNDNSNEDGATTVIATESTTETTLSTTETTQANTTETVPISINFTPTPESLASEEELITFLTNRQEDIKTIINDKAITELPLEVQNALKEEIDFIWYEETMAGFTYSSLTNETKTKVLDIYGATKKVVEDGYSDYSSEYTIHYIKTNSDLETKYQEIADAIKVKNQTTEVSNKTEAATTTNKPVATTEVPVTSEQNESVPEIDDGNGFLVSPFQ